MCSLSLIIVWFTVTLSKAEVKNELTKTTFKKHKVF